MSKHKHPPTPTSGHGFPHRFGQRRPSVNPPHPQQSPLFAGDGVQPLPAPTGTAPYRLDLATIVPDAVAAARQAGGIEFHMVGDTSGVKDPNPQLLVAQGLEKDSAISGQYGRPAFFYHLGDVIYFDGEAS